LAARDGGIAARDFGGTVGTVGTIDTGGTGGTGDFVTATWRLHRA